MWIRLFVICTREMISLSAKNCARQTGWSENLWKDSCPSFHRFKFFISERGSSPSLTTALLILRFMRIFAAIPLFSWVAIFAMQRCFCQLLAALSRAAAAKTYLDFCRPKRVFTHGLKTMQVSKL